MLKSSLKRIVVLCLALSLAAVAAAGGPSSTRNVNQTNKNGPAKQTGARRASASSKAQGDGALRARAKRLHSQSIVIDTHNDITSPLLDDGFDLAMRGDDPNVRVKTHTDLRRMKAGGLGAEFFAVYVGKEFVNKKPSEGGGSARRALDVIDVVLEQVRRHPESLETASTAADISRIARSGKIAALMGIEGGHAI